MALNEGAQPKNIPIEEPPFRSTHDALKFAMNFMHGTVQRTGLAGMMHPGGGDGRGLSGLSGAAQSGMILSEVERMSAPGRWLLVGGYTEQRQPCACRSPCCQGWRENPRWADAIDQLTEYTLLTGLVGTISHYRLRRALVMRLFGIRTSLIKVADACGIDRHTAGSYYARIAKHLNPEQSRTFHMVDARLRAVGIVI